MLVVMEGNNNNKRHVTDYVICLKYMNKHFGIAPKTKFVTPCHSISM